MSKAAPKLRWPPVGSLTTPNAALAAPAIVAAGWCALLGFGAWFLIGALDQSGLALTTDHLRLSAATVGVLCGVGSFAAFRLAHQRLRTLIAITAAARAAAEGATHPDQLTIEPAESPDALAWNGLVPRLLSGEAATAPMLTHAAASAGQDATTPACDALWLGLLVVDADATISYANGAAAVLLGRRPGGLSGTPAADLLDEATHARLLETLAGRGPARSTLTVTRDLDPQNAATLRIALRRFDGPAGRAAVLTVEDATTQVAADRARTAFVEQAAHELRTPLTNIQLYIEELIDLPDADRTARARAINIISQEATRLDRIVADMLSVSEIEAGAMSLSLGDVRLEPLMNDLRGEYAAQAQDKQIALEFDLPPKFPLLRADRDKLVIILHNVLGNALKYTPTGGRVCLTMTEDAGNIVFEVADSGIGIPPDQLDKVFERFYRVKDERTADIVGTGLGLPMARELARMHGGDITVESTPDVGSTFTVTIPTRHSHAGTNAPATRAA